MRIPVKVSDNVHAMTVSTEKILAQAPQVDIYQQGNSLVRVQRLQSSLTIQPINTAALTEIVSSSCEFISYKKKGEELEEKSVPPPRTVVEALASRGSWPKFRHLRGVTEAPTLRPDGTILNRPGFDRDTGLVYDPNGVTYQIPEEPSQEDARKALDVLAEPFREFCFASEVYRSANYAALLTALVRPAIAGSVPVFSFEAVAQGTGKTLLADLSGIIVTGQRVPHLAQPRDEDEDCKRITSLMVKGARIILVDNITRRFGHGTLGALITSPVWDDRLLGGNQTGPWDNLSVWYVTGNNMAYHDDLVRRVIPIFLDANMERPEQRTGFIHERIDDWTIAHRAELVSAALTVVRAYAVAGWPKQYFPAYGSFDSWSRWVRSPLVWLGLPDPCEARTRIEEEGDTQLGTWGAMLSAWRLRFGGAAHTIASAIEDDHKPLIDLFATLAPPKRGNEKTSVLHLSYVFRQYKGRPVQGLRLVHQKNRLNTGIWSVLSSAELSSVKDSEPEDGEAFP